MAHLKVANWNLQRSSPLHRRLSQIESDLSFNDTGIWFLTETHEDIEPNEGFYACYSGTQDRSVKERERRVGIWSKWPVERLDSYALDSARCAVGRIVDSLFGEVILFGTVLPWTNEWRGARRSRWFW